MKVVFYIGHHKVGSTALQTYLAQNWLRLAQAGILYPSVETRGFSSNLERALGAGDSAGVDDVNIREPHSALAYKMMSEVSEHRRVPPQFKRLPGSGQMLAAIQKERELLATQKDELAQRRSEVDLAAEKVQVETERLTELKTEVEALLARVEKAKSEDLDRLIGLYGNMKSKDAAAIMNDLDIEVTVMVLGAMPEREAAPIMAAMSPVRVRAVSKILLERSKLPGDQKLDGIRLK